MKKVWWILIIIGIVLIGWMFVRFVLGGSEDDWIKDSRGIYIKHGNPGSVPDYVREQQDAVDCALNLYNTKKQEGMQFSGQCLGKCSNYAVDIVHVPRTNEDNLTENQCSDYREGKVSKFIELDKNGGIVRIS
ncbi:MAG: hypothetical protein PHH54_06165 [Candidatus Nanoarchaeia archaeon]|nr:hypothetical protein [Candidatus Nanoarchaeia archaeon]MDD5741539.1 hypothetical protein [Candidatus Nanoarchaeia archaeon]